MNMKKIRLLSIVTALALTVSAALPVHGTQEVPDGTTSTSATTLPPETTLPVETEPTMPQGFQGDASVEYGSRTLNAQKPLADTDDYTAQVKGALLYDLGSDTLVFAQDIDERLYPASLTKVMTALVAIKYGSMDQTLTATDVVNITESGAQLCGLKSGDRMTLNQALHILLLIKMAQKKHRLFRIFCLTGLE